MPLERICIKKNDKAVFCKFVYDGKPYVINRLLGNGGLVVRINSLLCDTVKIINKLESKELTKKYE